VCRVVRFCAVFLNIWALILAYILHIWIVNLVFNIAMNKRGYTDEMFYNAGDSILVFTSILLAGCGMKTVQKNGVETPTLVKDIPTKDLLLGTL
jgi:hypothetical protein